MNYYELLGVSKNATPEEIRFAFRRRAREMHPDNGGTDEQMSELNKAKDTLLNEESRKVYDEEGHINDEVDLNPIEARNLLFAMFDKILEEAPEQSNPVRIVNEFLRQHIEELLRQIEQTLTKIARVKRINAKVDVKTEGADNLFDHYSKIKIRKLQDEIIQLQKIVDITNLAKVMMQELYARELGYSAGPLTHGHKTILSDAYKEFFGLN